MSPTERKIYDRAKTNGTTYTSRDEAVSAFTQKYRNTYTNSFTAEPAQRPEYIPDTYNDGATRYPVSYNPAYHGYGYYGPGHNWMMYDAFRDAAMMNMLMHHHHYAYTAAPAQASSDSDPDSSTPAQTATTGTAKSTTDNDTNPVGAFFGLLSIASFIWGIVLLCQKKWAFGLIAMFGCPPVGGIVVLIVMLTQRNNQQPVATPVAPKASEFCDPTPTSPNCWLNLPIGSVLTLKDRETIATAVAQQKSPAPQDFVVAEVLRVRTGEREGWMLSRLDDTTPARWVVATVADEQVDLGIYTELLVNTRQGLLEQGEFWLFQQPEDPDNYQPSELLYTLEMELPVTRDGAETQVIFTEDQPLVGARFDRNDGYDDQLATVSRYRATAQCDAPVAYVFELGGEDSPEGGLVTLLVGGRLEPSEVEVFPKTTAGQPEPA